MTKSRILLTALLGLCTLACAQTPQPAEPQTQSATYAVNPGDVLDIAFRWTPEFNQTVTVQPDGHASLTSAGDIKMSGLTLLQIRDEIVRLSSEKLVAPEVAVTLKDFERPRIAVAGEVVNPGKFDLRQPTTALQAILLAGADVQCDPLPSNAQRLLRGSSPQFQEARRQRPPP